MGEDLLSILTRFHREIIAPDIKSAIGDLRDEMNARFAEQNTHFDAIYKKLDRLETECHMITAGLKRVEERLDAVEQRLDKLALKSELIELKARVEGLQQQVRVLEERLEA